MVVLGGGAVSFERGTPAGRPSLPRKLCPDIRLRAWKVPADIRFRPGIEYARYICVAACLCMAPSLPLSLSLARSLSLSFSLSLSLSIYPE